MEIPALADLLDLQEVDLEIDRLLDQRQNLPELSEYKVANQGRVEADAKLSDLRERLHETALQLDKAEGELELTEIKLSESETRLYSGGMNARETENKRLEVRQLTERRGKMEEDVLELLDVREGLQAEVEAAEEEAAQRRDVESDLERRIAAAWKDIDLKLGRKEARKAEIAQTIPEELLSRYEKLRRSKEGVAIARLDHGQCGGCHLSLSATEQKEARQTDPPLCVHCRRMLVL